MDHLHSIRNPKHRSRAFTLIELVAVVGTVVLLAATLLPTLCRSSAQTKVTACADNFRQWAVSVNLYAKDNRDWLPRFDVSGGGTDVVDVGTNFCASMFPYGLDVPAWFCPVRPWELDAANTWCLQNRRHRILSIQDVEAYFGHTYPGELIINHNWWVPRLQSSFFPSDYSRTAMTFQPGWGRFSDPFIYGWPTRLDTVASSNVAFVSDKCGSGSLSGQSVGYDMSQISANTAHFLNGVLVGVNAAFVDGHVETRRPAKMRCVWSFNGSTYWFY